MNRISYAFWGLLMLANIVSNLLEKKGMTLLPRITSFSQLYSLKTIWSIATNPYIVLGIGISAAGIFLWLGALSSLKLSYLVPLSGLAYVLTAFVSWWLLGESISGIRWIGIGTIAFGVYLINR